MNEYHDIDLMRMQQIKNSKSPEELLHLLLYEYICRSHEHNEEYAKIVCDKISELLKLNNETLNTSYHDNLFS